MFSPFKNNGSNGMKIDPTSSVEQRHLETQARQQQLIDLKILVRCEGEHCGRAIPVERAHRFKRGDEETVLCMQCCPRCESN